MFDSAEKRGVVQKQNKLHGIGKSKFMIKNNLSQTSKNSNSIYGELKLSELLSNELSSIKLKFDQINEKLEETEYEKSKCEALLK